MLEKTGSGAKFNDVSILVCGLLMGSADVIPGVSGGTVALVVGIYERLVGSISSFDVRLVGFLRRRQWTAAAHHVDLRFLITLFIGIGAGVVALGGLMNRLLTTPATRAPTLAAFFGMILASTIVVAGMLQLRNSTDRIVAIVMIALGIAVAFGLTGLPPTEVEPSLPYVFFAGLVAISAMILPGISGAYVLLILGLYLHLTDILKALPKAQISAHDIVTVGVFGAGCAVGIVSFSKLLNWLLARYPMQTLAVLCGFMLGALRNIWPFQRDLTPYIAKLKHKQYENMIPDTIDGSVVLCLSMCLTAMTFIFVANRMSRPSRMSQVKQ